MGFDGIIFTDYSMYKPEQHQRTLGAYAVADVLRRRGLSIKVIDFAFSMPLDLIDMICKKWISKKTKFLGISTTFFSQATNLFSSSFEDGQDQISVIIHKARTYNADLKIIQGGGWAYSPHPLAEKIFSGQNGETELLNYFSEIFPNLNSDPFNFVSEIPYFGIDDIILNSETLPVETARGCIFDCKFCGFTLRSKKKNDYIRDADGIASLIQKMNEKFNTNHFYIAEDTFNESTEKLLKLKLALLKVGLAPRLTCYARLDLIYRNPSMLDLLYEIGVRGIMFGIETFDHQAGIRIGKGLSPSVVQKTLKEIKDRYPDLYLGSGFIVGLPGESLESIIKTNQWLIANPVLDHWNFQPLYLDLNSTNPYRSEFSKNFANYGYRINSAGAWENENFDFKKAYEISNILNVSNEESGFSKAYPWTLFSALQFLPMKEARQMNNDQIYRALGQKKLSLYFKKLNNELNSISANKNEN